MGRPPRPDLHEALLEAARAEFATRGLERARVEDITRRAGASKGAFYLHFDGKEEAFEELLQRFMGAMEDQARRRECAEDEFRSAHAGMGEPELRDRQVEFDCQADLELLDMLWRNRQILHVIESAAGLRYQRPVNEFRRRMQAFITARMAQKQAAGWIRRDLDPTVIGDILIGTYEGFVRRMADLNERPDFTAWLRSLGGVLYHGILQPSNPSVLLLAGDRPAGRARAPIGERRSLTRRSRKVRR